MSRETTNKLLEAVASGWFDNYELIVAFCKFLSEDDVREFVRVNDLTLDFDEEEAAY